MHISHHFQIFHIWQGWLPTFSGCWRQLGSCYTKILAPNLNLGQTYVKLLLQTDSDVTSTLEWAQITQNVTSRPLAKAPTSWRHLGPPKLQICVGHIGDVTSTCLPVDWHVHAGIWMHDVIASQVRLALSITWLLHHVTCLSEDALKQLDRSTFSVVTF